MDTSQLATYIFNQIQAGLTPADITAQLKNAGWSDELIQKGFDEAHSLLVPTQAAAPHADPAAQPTTLSSFSEPETGDVVIASSDNQQSANPHEPVAATPAIQTLPEPAKRGRLKTGWLLFKQSFAIITKNPSLWRYMIISIIIQMLLIAVYVTLFIVDSNNAKLLMGSEDFSPLGVIVAIPFVLAISTVNYFFAVALSSHVLQLFRGKQTTYKENVATAKSKLPAILLFSIIATTVGWILTQIEQRFKLLGWIISKILGTLWNLATVFAIPIIADSDTSGAGAIKESIKLFKDNWGETITGRTALGGVIWIFYCLVWVPFCIVIIILFASLLGVVGLCIGLFILIASAAVISTTVSLATNVLNIALYYYAHYKAIPPAFSPELLASAFKHKKVKKEKKA